MGDALGNPFVLGALRCMDGAYETLEAVPEENIEPQVLFRHAIEFLKRSVSLLERALDTSAQQ